MADFLDEKRSEIGARLKELKPLVEEYQRLQAAAAALDGIPATAAAPSPQTSAARSSAKRRSSNSGTGRRGRPKGSGTRGAEALALVRETPGMIIPEIAEKMGIKQNYLYRLLPGLAKDEKVEKRRRSDSKWGWYPKEAA